MNLYFRVLTVFFVLGLSSAAMAQDTLTYQGNLLDAGGQAINASYPMGFALYAEAEGGEALWREAYESVDVVDGSFTVELGGLNAFDAGLSAEPTLYLGITVNEGIELSPRMKVATTFRAHWARHAQDVRGEDIHPRTVSIDDTPVIDQWGQWVGDPTGLRGPDGPPGLQGEAGPAGEPGRAGERGPAGADFDVNADWDMDGFVDWLELMAGTDPADGTSVPADADEDGIPDVLRGPAGIPGERGEQGEQGNPGERGEQGNPGERGEQGIQGIPGTPGEGGEQGIDGNPGDRGEQGEQGPPGEDGVPCQVVGVDEGIATLMCPDGSSVEWPVEGSITPWMPFAFMTKAEWVQRDNVRYYCSAEPTAENPCGINPPPEMAPHLLMPHPQLVIIDYPEHLTAAGLNHREVIEAAIAMFPRFDGQPQRHGFWEKGEIQFQRGRYLIDQEIEWPGRLNLMGASPHVRDGGTQFIAQAPMTVDDYIIRMHTSGRAVNVNSSFFQHLHNVHFNGNNLSNGVAWGGAQSSTMKNVEVQGIPEGGTCVLIQTGTNNMTIEAVWCDGEARSGTTGFKGGPIIEGGVTFIGCKAESIDVGFDLRRGDHYIVGAYFENIRIPVIRRGTTGNTRFMGLSVKNIVRTVSCDDDDNCTNSYYSERDDDGNTIINGTHPKVFALPDGFSNFYATGMVRESHDSVGYERSGQFYQLIARSNFVFPDGRLSSAQMGYEINVLDQVRRTALDLNARTALSLGRRYVENFGAGGLRDLTFSGPVEESKKVELRTTASGEVTLRFPESVTPNSPIPITEITLAAGYHVLVWERMGGLWWLTVDGSPGERGEVGQQGEPGQAGGQGAQGPPGQAGQQGPQGPPGQAGGTASGSISGYCQSSGAGANLQCGTAREPAFCNGGFGCACRGGYERVGFGPDFFCRRQ